MKPHWVGQRCARPGSHHNQGRRARAERLPRSPPFPPPPLRHPPAYQAPLIGQDAHRLRPEVLQQVLLLLGRQLGRQVPDEEGAVSPGWGERSGAWASSRQRQRRLGPRHLPRSSRSSSQRKVAPRELPFKQRCPRRLSCRKVQPCAKESGTREISRELVFFSREWLPRDLRFSSGSPPGCGEQRFKFNESLSSNGPKRRH